MSSRTADHRGGAPVVDEHAGAARTLLGAPYHWARMTVEQHDDVVASSASLSPATLSCASPTASAASGTG